MKKKTAWEGTSDEFRIDQMGISDVLRLRYVTEFHALCVAEQLQGAAYYKRAL
jgi:hypothetical protein